MRLWAVVVGKRGYRHITFQPKKWPHLAVFEDQYTAQIVKRDLLKTIGHKDVYVIPFESK